MSAYPGAYARAQQQAPAPQVATLAVVDGQVSTFRGDLVSSKVVMRLTRATEVSRRPLGVAGLSTHGFLPSTPDLV